MNAYVKIREIGRGAQGAVSLVKAKESDKKYVVKEIPINILNEEERESTLRESQFLKSLCHPNIVEYVDSFVEGDYMFMIMSYCAGGDLALHIKKKSKDGGLFEETQILDWFVQICGAMEFVHSRHILHRDLKTNNIFLTDRNVVKLGDFGIARILENTLEKADTVVGTPFYMSPEVCENNPYDYKSDVWAMGCILYEMCTLVHAFKANNLLGIVFKIVQGDFDPISNEYSDGLKELITQMLSKEPGDRPTVKQILHSAFIMDHIEVFMKTGGSTMGKEVPQLVRKAKEMGAGQRRRKGEQDQDKTVAYNDRRRSSHKAAAGHDEDEFAHLPHAEKMRRLKERRLAKEEAQHKAARDALMEENVRNRQTAKQREAELLYGAPRVGSAPSRGQGQGRAESRTSEVLGSRSMVNQKVSNVKFAEERPIHGRGYQQPEHEDTFIYPESKKYMGYSDDDMEESMGGDSHLLEPRGAKHSPAHVPLAPSYEDRPITTSGTYNIDAFEGAGAKDFDFEVDDDVRGDECQNETQLVNFAESDEEYSDNFESDEEGAYTIGVRPSTSSGSAEEQQQREEEHNQEMNEVLERFRMVSENAGGQSPHSHQPTPPPRSGSNKAVQEALASRVRDARRKNIENMRVRLIKDLGLARFQKIYDYYRQHHSEGNQVSKPDLLKLVNGNRELIKKADDIENLICLEEMYC